MKVHELIELLQEMPEEADVRVATQPTWPLAARLAGAVEGDEGLVWLVQGDEMGYASRELWERL